MDTRAPAASAGLGATAKYSPRIKTEAKTRIARTLGMLLDDYIPYIAGSELYDDPLNPISWYGINTIKELGDKIPSAIFLERYLCI